MGRFSDLHHQEETPTYGVVVVILDVEFWSDIPK